MCTFFVYLFCLPREKQSSFFGRKKSVLRSVDYDKRGGQAGTQATHAGEKANSALQVHHMICSPA